MRHPITGDELPTDCLCHACIKAAGIRCNWMILCPTCGNKRCPHASDHALSCTGSNEPGQRGSVYE